jgi:hypothetical protein
MHEQATLNAKRGIVKLPRWTIVAAVLLALAIGALTACSVLRTRGATLIEFDIHQDLDLIRLSLFSEPPQFAIWLEDPASHRLQTVFVTYRSASGDWIGKTECPDALPRWFEVFGQETNSIGLPRFDNPAPDAVTGATPQTEHFTTSVEVEPGSRWICWIEVNLAGDFNDKYKAYNKEQKTVDLHFSGQPPLIYRAEITAVPGEQIVPELYGQSVLDNPPGETVQPLSDDVTTARDIFKAIDIRVIQHKY